MFHLTPHNPLLAYSVPSSSTGVRPLCLQLVLDERPGVDPGEAVNAAEKLLRELPSSPRQAVLECYTLMAYKAKVQVEKACAKLLELLNIERDYVPALVCLSQAYLMLKQSPKARK